ncbi:hypothetical protein R1sor_010658 [Riccia sorocarpa]|uniref:Uncharacterized protein n=1 Tax=Riccia sorocarpa TaxID=122646 RepID=A0ABD3I2C3_9MARC
MHGHCSFYSVRALKARRQPSMVTTRSSNKQAACASVASELGSQGELWKKAFISKATRIASSVLSEPELRRQLDEDIDLMKGYTLSRSLTEFGVHDMQEDCRGTQLNHSRHVPKLLSLPGRKQDSTRRDSIITRSIELPGTEKKQCPESREEIVAEAGNNMADPNAGLVGIDPMEAQRLLTQLQQKYDLIEKLLVKLTQADSGGHNQVFNKGERVNSLVSPLPSQTRNGSLDYTSPTTSPNPRSLSAGTTLDLGASPVTSTQNPDAGSRNQAESVSFPSSTPQASTSPVGGGVGQVQTSKSTPKTQSYARVAS